MEQRSRGSFSLAALMRAALWLIPLGVTLFAYACGGDSHQTSDTAKYPIGISEDIEQQLKYDARVDSFEQSGEDLIVNVNDEWPNSPSGMRERTLGQWYSLWQPAHGPSSKIVVKYEGNELEVWTADKGYQPASGERKKASEG